MRRKRNLEHLANCPFCGNHELEFGDSTGDITCNCCAYTFYDTPENNRWWNSRPIEDALRAENERLREALREIANSAGEDACGYTTGEGHSNCIWKARQAMNEVKE